MITLSIDEGKQLLSLCRAGKLYEVDAWINAGKSLQVPEELRTNPLRVAIDLGFHSLIQLLAIHEDSEAILNDALGAAVDLRSLELVQLLLKHGAQIRGIPIISVLRSWDPTLMQLFLDGGADAVTEYPFARAFSEKIRTALSRFVGYRRSHPELDREMQEQLDRALRFFARDGNLKWISLLMWAGGDPRALGPKLDDEDDPELYVTALQEGASGHSVDVLKKLKPDPGRDDLTELLEYAVLGLDIDMIRYLLELGARPNNKENGGSIALDRCIGWMHLENIIRWDRRWKRTKWDVHRSLEAMKELSQHGAVWRPHEKHQVKWLRKTLLECEPEVTIEFLKVIFWNHACSIETLKDLFSTPRIREHISNQHWWLARLKLTDLLVDHKRKRGKAAQALVVSPELLSRYNREELYEKVWSRPTRILAQEYGISDVGLAKVCRKLGVPVPGRGYWAKKAAGRIVPKRPSLLPID